MAEVKEQGPEQGEKPALPAGKSEPRGLLQRRITRRQALAGAATLGAGGAVVVLEKLGVLGEKRAERTIGDFSKPEQAVIKQVVETPKPLLRFERVKSLVGVMPGTDEERLRALEILDRFILTERNIEELKRGWLAIDPSFELIRRKYGNLDLTAVYGRGTPYGTEEDFLKSQLPFFQDEKQLDSIFRLHFSNLNPDKALSSLIRTLEDIQRQNILFKNNSYLEMGTKSGKGPMEIDFSGYTGSYNVERLKGLIQFDWVDVPNVGQIKVKVVNGYVGAFDQNTGVTLGDDAIDLHKAKHEFYHSIDPKSAYERLIPYFKPHEFAQLLALREQLLADPQIGRRYPEIARIFPGDDRGGPELQWFNGETGSEQLSSAIGFTFDEKVLPTGYVKQIVDIRQKEVDRRAAAEGYKPKFGGPIIYLDLESYETFEKTLATEREELDNLAKTSAVWAYVVDKLREYKTYFNNSGWQGVPGIYWFRMGEAPAFWQALPTMAQGILAEGFFRNDQRLVDLFDSQTRARLVQSLVARLDWVDDEKFAKILENNASYLLVANFLSPIKEKGRISSDGPMTLPLEASK